MKLLNIKLPKYNVATGFAFVYLAIALSTFKHSAWAGSFAFEGGMPLDETNQFIWYLSGYLIAIAIDVGMFVTAHQLPHERSRKGKVTLIMAFSCAAIASAYTQILYTGYHSEERILGSGVSNYWAPLITQLSEARVIIMPVILPIFAIIYTIARMATGGHVEIPKMTATMTEAEITILRENHLRLPQGEMIPDESGIEMFIHKPNKIEKVEVENVQDNHSGTNTQGPTHRG